MFRTSWVSRDLVGYLFSSIMMLFVALQLIICTVFSSEFKSCCSNYYNPSFSGNTYSISHLAEALDERLQHITPTLEISRLPRSVTEHLKYWKLTNCDHFSYITEFRHFTGFCQMSTLIITSFSFMLFICY